jgi:hypothetical protein
MLGTVIACVMFLWDYILTFGMEVDLVWKSKWNFTKGLYLFQRYFPFTEFIWLVLYCQSDVVSIFSCSIFYIAPMGEILGETGRRRVCYADGGS